MIKLISYEFVEDTLQCVLNREPGHNVAGLLLPFLGLACRLGLVEIKDKEDN